ncbi:hypothetical protein LA080_006934 [Diaporthe eres]|nr:hypothetical protein LA080_006934 [Diaporthe eres]
MNIAPTGGIPSRYRIEVEADDRMRQDIEVISDSLAFSTEMRKTPPLSHCPSHYSHFSHFSPGRPLAMAYGTIRAESPFSCGIRSNIPPV